LICKNKKMPPIRFDPINSCLESQRVNRITTNPLVNEVVYDDCA
jgi:hypothetical protein